MKKAYGEWIEKAADKDGSLDLPELDLRVPRDEAETNIALEDW